MVEGTRPDGRRPEDLRKVEILPGFTKWAEGSVLCCFGDTKVVCNATIEDRVPSWLKEQRPGSGWIAAEYAMLPRVTDRRSVRESVSGRQGGRTHEISRLIGRALRAVVKMEEIGERTITLDCDVLQADGGTRTAAITGSWLALHMALDRLVVSNVIKKHPIKHHVAAVSLGIVGGEIRLDLAYVEDQNAETDLNLVMTDEGGIVEIQGTAERTPFSRGELDRVLSLGTKGIEKLIEAQKRALKR